jgi:UDP-glucose 4-epimerase
MGSHYTWGLAEDSLNRGIMAVLVTGGAGMVGSHVAELLENRGDKVIVLDNFETGRKEHLVNLTNALQIEGSVSDKKLIEEIFESHDVSHVVHTAASYAVSTEWQKQIETNTLGTANIAELAKNANARVVYFQTALCYGDNPSIQPVPLDYPRQPVKSSYAISKTAGEFYLEQSGVDFVTFRLANIIGPRNLSGPLPIFFKRLSEGQACRITQSRRDFVDVRDLAEAVIHAIDGVGNGAYHFSSGSDVEITTLFEEICGQMNLDKTPNYEIVKDDSGPKSILLDPTRTQNDFKIKSLRTLSETVSGAISYYKQYGVSREVTHMRNKDEK